MKKKEKEIEAPNIQDLDQGIVWINHEDKPPLMFDCCCRRPETGESPSRLGAGKPVIRLPTTGERDEDKY